jgi:hypothetical protein
MHGKMQMLQVLLFSLLSKKDAIMDKVPKQPMTHTDTSPGVLFTQSNKSSITIQVVTNDTLLQLRKRRITGMRTGLKAVVYWWLLTSANSRRRGIPGVLVYRVEVTILTNLHPLASMQGILRVCQSTAKVVDLSLSGKQMVAQVQTETHAMRHHSSEDLRVHSRDLESILLPPRVQCVDRVLPVTVPRAVPAHQRLPSSVSHCLSTGHTRGGTSLLVDHLLPIKDLHGAGELHAPWPRNTLDLVL